jgi:hypothetical protein
MGKAQMERWQFGDQKRALQVMPGGINRIGAAHVFRKILAEASHRLTVKKQPLQTGQNISLGQFIEEDVIDVRCCGTQGQTGLGQ